MNTIRNCRTNISGDHVDECDRCGARQSSYNACRHRHCPKCESFKAAEPSVPAEVRQKSVKS